MSSIKPLLANCDASIESISKSQGALEERLKKLEAVLDTYNPESPNSEVVFPSLEEHTEKVQCYAPTLLTMVKHVSIE